MSAVWDKRARFYDLFEGSDLRRGPTKAALFREMTGRVLFVAIGTGLDIKHFPPDREIVAIDLSEEMLRRAAPRCRHLPETCTWCRQMRSIYVSRMTRSIPSLPPARCVQCLISGARLRSCTECCDPEGGF